MTPSVRSFVREQVPGLAGKVLARVRPCVNASSRKRPDGSIPVGHSKLGGRPDAPEGFEWPTHRGVPCWFLAQFNLRELGRPSVGFPFPRAGLLSFFYHDDNGPPGPGSRVYHFPAKGLRRVQVVADPRYEGLHRRHLYPRELTLAQGYCLPRDIRQYALTRREQAAWDNPADPRGAAVLGRERDTYEDFNYFWEMFHHRFAPASHRLFGLPPYDPPPRGHQLLASFGQMEDRLNFYIPGEDVATRQFGRLRVTYECT